MSDILNDQHIVVLSKTQKIVVNADRSVTVVNAGPVGPGGLPGDPGPALTEHIESAEPHPAYDDMPDLTVHFENGLF